MIGIISVTFPFFALVFAGFLATTRRMLPPEAISGLNTFVLSFALPCMLYRFAATTPIVRLMDAGVSLTYLVCAVAMVAIGVATARAGRANWRDSAFGALVAAFPNSGFMGVPLLVELLGPTAAGPAIVALAVDMVCTSSLCIGLSQLDGTGERGRRVVARQALRGMLVNPLPWAIGLGCVATAAGWRLPLPLQRGVDMLAVSASPVALFAIGGVLARARMRRAAAGAASPAAPPPIRPRQGVWLLAACKLMLHPALLFVIGRAAIALGVPLEPAALTVLVLSAALPSASNVPMLAERLGADADRIAQVVLATTVVAFVTFPVAVAVVLQR